MLLFFGKLKIYLDVNTSGGFEQNLWIMQQILPYLSLVIASKVSVIGCHL